MDAVLGNCEENFHLIVVDDCSRNDTVSLLQNFRFNAQNVSFTVMCLARNRGHQGAIKSGLNLAEELSANHVIVMDSDGEDDPHAIAELCQLLHEDIVFVRRGKRNENWKFKLGYRIYQLLFQVLVGRGISYGNYGLISRRVLEEVVRSNYFHYPAFLAKLKYDKRFITFDRQPRIGGQSKMNKYSLVIHGLKSFIEFSQEFFVAFLKLFILLFIGITACVFTILYKKFISQTAQLGWTSDLLISFITIAILCLGFFVLGVLIVYGFKSLEESQRPWRSDIRDIFTSTPQQHDSIEKEYFNFKS